MLISNQNDSSSPGQRKKGKKRREKGEGVGEEVETDYRSVHI